jgi:MFS family permease
MTTAHPGAAAPATTRVLWIIPAVYFLFVAGEFTAMTQLALQLTARGESALAVGVLGSALWAGLFVASTRAHAWVEAHGHARVFVGASAAAVLAVATLPAHEYYAGWLVAVTALGLAGGLVWVAGESWLAEAAPRERRGLLVGLFETSVGLALLAGPLLVSLGLATSTDPLLIALAGVALAFAASLALLGHAPPPHDETIGGAGTQAASDWKAVALPLAALAAVGGLMESGISALLPSISMRLGFEVQAAAFLGAVIGAGSALLQSPFGALADRIGLPRAMGLAWVLIVATTAALAAAAGHPEHVLWVAGFVLGGVGGAVYTLIVIELGHRLAGGALVRAMGLLVTAYTGGTAGGPALGGWLFDATGLRGLALMLLALAIVGAVLAWRALSGSRAPPSRA